MPNPYNNKIQLADGTVLLDLSSDTLSSADQLAQGVVAHDRTGATVTGTIVIPSAGTEGTPVATKGSVSNHSISITPSVTNVGGVIQGGTHTGTAVTVSASELATGNINIMQAGQTDVTQYATATVTSGTATASATKGTVSNHSVTVTPLVTRTAGYIGAGSASGTAVTVSASELVSGNLAITENGTNIDVANYSTVSVAVEGGGGTGAKVEFLVEAVRSSASSISFTGLKGEPIAFYAGCEDGISTSATATVVAFVYDGQTLHAQTLANQITYDDSSLSYTYNNGTLTITSNGAAIASGVFYLSYAYGGTSENIDTKDVQVGSGATSITFTGLEDEPIAWSCIFKSNFSTSSGYQRVVYVDYENGSIYGVEMDSGTHTASHWTASYNNGSLTISSNSTSQGGYFHQPGYYQLTYIIGEASPYEKVSKTYRASTTAQSEKIEPSTGYDAMSEVNVTIPAVTQTNLTAANIKQGTTVTISNGSTNLWSVTGTYSGGGSGTSLTLLKTEAIGELATTDSSATNTGKSMTVTGYNDYDILIVDVSVDTLVEGKHSSTVSIIICTGTSDVNTKNTFTVASNKWNSRLRAGGTTETRQSTTAYGVYANSASVSGTTMTIPFYYRYSTNNTGAIGGTYTARVYGLNLYDMIGG